MFTRLNELITGSKVHALVVILLIIVPMALGFGSTIQQQFWFGINEILINSDCPDGIRYGIGGMGIAHAFVEGLIWGAVVGNLAGAVAGAVAAT